MSGHDNISRSLFIFVEQSKAFWRDAVSITLAYVRAGG